MKKERALIGFWFIASLVGFAWLFSGCAAEGVEGDAEGLGRGPVVRLDAGTIPDTQVVPDLVPAPDVTVLSDLVPAVDTTPVLPPVDARPGVEVQVAPDVQPARDVLPAPDLAPECPYVAWQTKPVRSEDRWSLVVQLPVEATCFTACGAVVYIGLAQVPRRSVVVNGTSIAAAPNEYTGYLASAAIDGLWVVRVGAGDSNTITLVGWPTTNSTGACP